MLIEETQSERSVSELSNFLVERHSGDILCQEETSSLLVSDLAEDRRKSLKTVSLDQHRQSPELCG